ncbi:MAG: hypothetical protein AAGA10_15220 [Bacteroidota bacterium]
MKKIFFLYFLLAFYVCYSQPNPSSFVSWESRVRYNLSILDKQGAFMEQLTISSDGVFLYATPGDKQRNRPEIHIFPEEIEAFLAMAEQLPRNTLLQMYQGKKTRKWESSLLNEYERSTWKSSRALTTTPLTGMRVAIDPGHIGGSMEEAELEGKYVKVRPTNSRPGVAFWEANLNLTTAFLIKKELEKLGAEVMMTREKPGQSAIGPLYKDWRKNYFLKAVDQEVRAGRMSQQKAKFWRTQATENDIFRRFFNILDLRMRATKINAFRPHATLIIHYNVDKDNWDNRDREGYFKPGYANYSMAFVPGSMGLGDLRTLEGRINFLRLLLGYSIPESIRLSSLYLDANTYYTHVPIVQRGKEPDYLPEFCLPTSKPGVYARNLALTRLVKSPLCYGESLCQDNWRELLWLEKRGMEVEGIPTSTRVQLVAAAYIKAVKQFAGVEDR